MQAERAAAALAYLECCGLKQKAKSYRLASLTNPDYKFQRAYVLPKCKVCKIKLMQWRGELPDGSLDRWNDIDYSNYKLWQKRIDNGEAKPEAQLMSEYSERIAGPIDGQIQYQTKLCEAHKWYKGNRVVVST
jgi:hypothetical protein